MEGLRKRVQREFKCIKEVDDNSIIKSLLEEIESRYLYAVLRNDNNRVHLVETGLFSSCASGWACLHRQALDE